MAIISGQLVRSRWHTVPMMLFLVVVGYLAAACSPTSVLTVSEPAGRLPEKFTGNIVAGPHKPLEWWKTFNDPTLDRVVEAALVSNFDLAEAVARVKQARARARIANAVRYPMVRPSAGVNDVNTPTNAGVGAQLDKLGLGSELQQEFSLAPPDRLGLSTYSFDANFAYELDFWGRNLNDARAARAERLASEWDFRVARIGTVAETVRTYLEIAYLRRQRELSGEIVEILQGRERLATTRYNRGLSSTHDLYMARLNLWNAQAELPAIEGQLADAEGRLWVLLGGYRADLASMLSDSLSPSVALDPVPVGIPADLLAQRPDVGAARQRMEGARYAVGARRAELLPSVSLSGSIGLQSADFHQWFDPTQWFRTLTLNLLGPAFQGTRLRDNVTLAETRLKEAVIAYERSVVTAVNEVEAVLTGLEASHHRYTLLRSSAEEARAEAAFQELRYGSGVGSYEDFLVASQTLISANSVLAAAERDLGYARLALHRALGGVWTVPEPDAFQISSSARAAGRRATSIPTE